MTRYYILYPSGAGGNFLASVLAKFQGLECATVISETGDCHDLGQGNWKGSTVFGLIGDYFWDRAWPQPILVGHYSDLENLLRREPGVEIILIDFNDSDIEIMARMHATKRMHPIWTQQEYNQVAGPDWPEYHPDNILTSEMVQREITEFRIPEIKKWQQAVPREYVNYTIDFKTILGIDDKDLIAELTAILGTPRDSVQEFVHRYQTINQNLYGLKKNDSSVGYLLRSL
jgi:hypothetical protein